MPHHHRHHRNHRPEAPIPPIPPLPPIPPMGCDEARSFPFEDIVRHFAAGGGHWRGNWGPFHFDFGNGNGFGGHGGRGSRRYPGRKRMFEGGELRLVLLKLIADEPRHGYDCIRAIEEMTGGEYAPSPGVVYPTLTMLEEMGQIEEQKSADNKKVFAATADGRAHLEENEERIDALLERLSEMKPEQSADAGPAIGRAVRNLMTALSHRIGRDGLDDELLHEIAGILDEAAQRIERVK